MAAMIVFDVVILLPYLVCCLPETLPPSKRQAMQWRAAAPGLGMSCSTRCLATFMAFHGLLGILASPRPS